jgi:tetratricopeptide (TPR) repeat protein
VGKRKSTKAAETLSTSNILLLIILLITVSRPAFAQGKKPPSADHNGAYMRQQPGETLASLNQLLRNNPNDLSALYRRTKMMTFAGHGEGLVPDCDRLIAADPQSVRFPYLYTMRAMAWRDEDENDKALKDLEMTKKLGQIEDTYYMCRSGCLQASGRMVEAIDDYTAFIKRHPDGAWAYCSRAASFEAGNKFDQALADLGTAIKLEPKNFTYLASRARLLERLQRYDAAIADLSTMLAIRPDDETVYFMRAKAYMTQSKYPLALADLNRAISLDQVPTRSEYLCRAQVYEKLGKFNLAKQDREHAEHLR